MPNLKAPHRTRALIHDIRPRHHHRTGYTKDFKMCKPLAAKPTKKWRLYVFKGKESLEPYHIHRQSAYLLGRERRVADIPLDHDMLPCLNRVGGRKFPSPSKPDSFEDLASAYANAGKACAARLGRKSFAAERVYSDVEESERLQLNQVVTSIDVQNGTFEWVDKDEMVQGLGLKAEDDIIDMFIGMGGLYGVELTRDKDALFD